MNYVESVRKSLRFPFFFSMLKTEFMSQARYRKKVLKKSIAQMIYM